MVEGKEVRNGHKRSGAEMALTSLLADKNIFVLDKHFRSVIMVVLTAGQVTILRVIEFVLII